MSEIILHVGMPKTGTTFMQSIVFKKHPDILSLFDFHSPDLPGHSQVRSINSGEIDDAGINILSSSFKSIVDKNKDAISILSWEDLSQKKFVHMNLKAEFLYAAFPNARINISIRNPITFVKSWYTQWSRTFRGAFPKNDFLSIDQWLDLGLAKRGMPALYQQESIDAYASRFGTDSVNVLTYEDMVRDTHMFMKEFLDGYKYDEPKLEKLCSNSRVHESLSNDVIEFLRVFRTNEFGISFEERRKYFMSICSGEVYERTLEFQVSAENDPVSDLLEAISPLLGDDFGPDIQVSDRHKSLIFDITAPQLSIISDEFDLNLKEKGYIF